MSQRCHDRKSVDLSTHFGGAFFLDKASQPDEQEASAVLAIV
jgi:hypothetical protein